VSEAAPSRVRSALVMSRKAVRVRSSALLSVLSPRWSLSWGGSSEKEELTIVWSVALTVDREKSRLAVGLRRRAPAA
jgi:hypothetical protein